MRPSSSRNNGGVGVMVTATEGCRVNAGVLARPETVLKCEAREVTEEGEGSSRRGGRPQSETE